MLILVLGFIFIFVGCEFNVINNTELDSNEICSGKHSLVASDSFYKCQNCDYRKETSKGFKYKITDVEMRTCTITDIGDCVDTNLYIPSTIEGFRVTSIGSCAFYYCHFLKEVTIPDCVLRIEEKAFLDCSQLESITFAENGDLIEIGDHAFQGCSTLQSVTIPNSVKSIGVYVFSHCRSLESITVKPQNTVYYSEGNCLIHTNTKSVISGCKSSVIPKNVTSIGDAAFSGCLNLKYFTIPDNIERIGEDAFSGCDNLKKITLSNNLKSIGRAAFRGCINLISVTIPNSVTTIEREAFYYCRELKSIIVSNNITNIEKYAFWECDNLEQVYYLGDASNWSEIYIGEWGNWDMINATRYFYFETQPTETGNYWHYVDGVPAAW